MIDHHGDSQMGYWGSPTSTVDWCERNYQYTPYIAEFWNTVSNLHFVALGTYGLVRAIREGAEWRFHVLYTSTILVGVGSAMFHGTLKTVTQQLDETPMIWAVLVWIFIVYNDELRRLPIRESTVIAILVGFGLTFAILHGLFHFVLVFQLLFIAFLVFLLLRLVQLYRASTDKRARGLCLISLYASVTGCGFWMLDYNLCSMMRELPIDPHGHAWWHVLMGIATYNAPLFLQFVHAERRNQEPEIVRSKLIVLRTIVIHHDKQATSEVECTDVEAATPIYAAQHSLQTACKLV